MLPLEKRIDILVRLGNYMQASGEEWMLAKEQAVAANAWFTPEHIEIAVQNITSAMLSRQKLEQWIAAYTLPARSKKVGIIMAGNIPLVGFHDMLCGFISGHHVYLKLSSKDEVLMKHLLAKMVEMEKEVADHLHIADQLKGMDAYIATGSNNSARYFEQYFAQYPHIIRRNRTSVAVLDGNETDEELQSLAKDVFLYFGLGCRNVTQLWVPDAYNFDRLLKIFESHESYIHHHKYKNNYDYHLAIYLLNRVPYLTNNSIILVENELPFSAVSVLHYKHYRDKEEILSLLQNDNNIQAVIARERIPFGASQQPGLNDYADGADTMQFLCNL